MDGPYDGWPRNYNLPNEQGGWADGGTILLPILTVPSEFLYCEHVLHRSLLKYVFGKCILGIDSCVAEVPELSEQM